MQINVGKDGAALKVNKTETRRLSEGYKVAATIRKYSTGELSKLAGEAERALDNLMTRLALGDKSEKELTTK